MSASASESERKYIYLVCNDGRSNKYWECIINGKVYTINFGGIGKSYSQTRKREFSSHAAAVEFMDKTVAKKLASQYHIVQDTLSKPSNSGSGDSSEEI